MAITKFEMENSFSTGKEGYDPEREQRERLIDHAQKQGNEAGFKTGYAQAMAEIESRTAALMEQMNGILNALFQDRMATEARLEAESALMAKLIGSKLARTLLKEQPEAEVEALIRECLLAGYNQPKIVARIAPQLMKSMESRIDEMRMTAGFVGELEIIANEEAGEQDCTVEWPNGGMNRNFQGLVEEINSRISAYIGTPIDALEEAFIPASAPKSETETEPETEPENIEPEETKSETLSDVPPSGVQEDVQEIENTAELTLDPTDVDAVENTSEDTHEEAVDTEASGEETLEPAPELVQELVLDTVQETVQEDD